MSPSTSFRHTRDLEEAARDGFRPQDVGREYTHPDLMFASARLALRAYVGTPKAIHGQLRLAEAGDSEESQRLHDSNLGPRYRDAAFETIVHFQHFAELVVKDVLRRDHELLVVVTGREHELLHDLLHGGGLDAPSENKVQTIEPSVALERLCALSKAAKLDPTYDFIVANRPFLEKLNALRNRLWHRGTFTLRFAALDELVGRYALPFLQQVSSHSAYQGRAAVLKLRTLACGIDPFQEIIAEFTRSQWSLPKVAFLKELARAAFENPLIDSDWFDTDNARLRTRAEHATREFPEGTVNQVIRCPVCGTTACAIYEMDDVIYEADGNEHDISWTGLAKCELCSLELRAEYGNPSDYGWTTIQDLWRDL